MSASIKVFAVLTAKEGRAGELEELLRGMVGPSRAEDGNIRYDLWRDAELPTRFMLDELYLDEAAAAAHKASRHFQHYLSRIGELADRLPMTVRAVDVV
ncbi:putative quinol monooxygenase [Rhizobium sp. BK251]|uniref:putative quinol monooxygenase n=1 Tax=Rhizobium sp. BK251 TaxID=2512125 RepID=UPI00104426BE|nr:putative quinol monooxygenase [Rhizobium sp. BK251]TCL67169.1 quinol monooxygenase YgiN [Rhizobium sp. BK251]